MKKYVIIIIISILIIAKLLFDHFTPEYPPLEVVTVEYNEVSIQGAVHIPGAYTIKTNSKLIELINYAGGLLPNADLSRVNFNEIISKKEYDIPFIKDEEEQITNRYNLNTVEYEQLVLLENISKTLATNIIVYQKTYTFKKVEDLLNVKGIGKKTYEKISKYFYI